MVRRYRTPHQSLVSFSFALHLVIAPHKTMMIKRAICSVWLPFDDIQPTDDTAKRIVIMCIEYRKGKAMMACRKQQTIAFDWFVWIKWQIESNQNKKVHHANNEGHNSHTLGSNMIYITKLCITHHIMFYHSDIQKLFWLISKQSTQKQHQK